MKVQTEKKPENSCKFINLKIFTLIELLVVIAIISILFSILMPALKKSRDCARSIACLSNMKQLGVAMNSYMVDYNGRFPDYGTDSSGSCWDAKLYSYVNYSKTGKTNLFHCPAGTHIKTGTPPRTEQVARGYAMNQYVAQDTDGLNGHVGKVRNDTSQMILVDFWHYNPGVENYDIGGGFYVEGLLGGSLSNKEYVSISSNYYVYLGFRHPGWSANYLRKDGSADNTKMGITGRGEEIIWRYYPNSYGASAYRNKWYRDGHLE